jgi:hypothetical protein
MKPLTSASFSFPFLVITKDFLRHDEKQREGVG